MSVAKAETNANGLNELAGRYLTFVLGHESYGIPVLAVREIIRAIDITPVPRMPAYVKGVINLRGKVLPVIDLRLRFSLAQAESTERTCNVVVQVKQANGVQAQMGLIVDAVEEVLQITIEDLEPPPDFGSNLKTDYIVGMARIKDGVKTLLDIDKIIAADPAEKIELAT